MIDPKTLVGRLESAIRGEKFAIAGIISDLEKTNSLPFRKDLFREIEKQGLSETGIVIGFTGTPGAGKSSLLSALISEFIKTETTQKIAIIAIDPSSAVSGGSILGDRVRMNIPARENRIYFRSQPSQLELGGLNPSTYHVIRFLSCLFDFVFIETVGIGQNEIEISGISDFTFLVMSPLGGDQIQFLKSGIMEIPDGFIINKCDEEELAMASFHQLQASLELLNSIKKDKHSGKLFRTSAINGRGIAELLQFIKTFQNQKNRSQIAQERIRKWVVSEYGKFGILVLEKMSRNINHSNYEEMEEKYLQQFLEFIRKFPG